MSSSEEPIISGYGSYIYPLYNIVKEVDENSIEEVISCNYKNRALSIESHGYFIISESRKTLAKDILNEIFGAFLLKEYEVFSLKDEDITYEFFNPNTGDCIMNRSMRGIYWFEREFGYDKEKILISKEKIQEILRFAEKITHHRKMRILLRTLLESFTLLRNEEHNASFILSWTIIEQYIENLWSFFISNNNVHEEKIMKLKRLDCDSKIRILNLCNIINHEMYELCMNFKKPRNNFIHNLIPVPNRTAESAYKFAKVLVNELVDKLEMMD